jgi:hypothetical protein
MSPAVYVSADSDRTTHDSLQTSAYAHVSSPLRRYVDLHNQRVLKSILFDMPPPPPPTLSHIQERAKANKSFSRDLFFLTVLSSMRETLSNQHVNALALTEKSFYVPEWRRVLTLPKSQRSTPLTPGSSLRVDWYADMTKPGWKHRMVFRISPIQDLPPESE